jgi:hypothetical protein
LPLSDATVERSIPVTAVLRTLLDLAAARIPESSLEGAINEADRLDLIDPESLRASLDQHVAEPGVGRLRSLLDRATFTLTDSELERAFLPIARAAGLPLRQARDRRRDQAHAAAGLVPLRFTHAQVAFEPGLVRATLGAVARRITSAG